MNKKVRNRKNSGKEYESRRALERSLYECGLFEITCLRIIYSNSEFSTIFEQNVFLTCSWRFLRSNTLEQLEFKLENNIGI